MELNIKLNLDEHIVEAYKSDYESMSTEWTRDPKDLQRKLIGLCIDAIAERLEINLKHHYSDAYISILENDTDYSLCAQDTRTDT